MQELKSLVVLSSSEQLDKREEVPLTVPAVQPSPVAVAPAVQKDCAEPTVAETQPSQQEPTVGFQPSVPPENPELSSPTSPEHHCPPLPASWSDESQPALVPAPAVLEPAPATSAASVVITPSATLADSPAATLTVAHFPSSDAYEIIRQQTAIIDQLAALVPLQASGGSQDK